MEIEVIMKRQTSQTNFEHISAVPPSHPCARPCLVLTWRLVLPENAEKATGLALQVHNLKMLSGPREIVS